MSGNWQRISNEIALFCLYSSRTNVPPMARYQIDIAGLEVELVYQQKGQLEIHHALQILDRLISGVFHRFTQSQVQSKKELPRSDKTTKEQSRENSKSGVAAPTYLMELRSTDSC
ncbi:hypothetical protein PVK06_000439 [Gossypium arboreum]|uniref:Uncharacterized protein n=1 Tax=Gossypium arboreum TaxID=29729 RepID=A0ABR0QYA5_GOSAR|nr:hypothetical protein PVK06_000439 [Gossypium arboreum]